MNPPVPFKPEPGWQLPVVLACPYLHGPGLSEECLAPILVRVFSEHVGSPCANGHILYTEAARNWQGLWYPDLTARYLERISPRPASAPRTSPPPTLRFRVVQSSQCRDHVTLRALDQASESVHRALTGAGYEEGDIVELRLERRG